MLLYSTRNKNHIVTLKQAVINGLAPDGGLYLPSEIPVLPTPFISDLHALTPHEIYFEICRYLLQNELTNNDLSQIIENVFQFDIPLVQLKENVFSLELFHGPTLAFKDVGARFMAALLSHFRQNASQKLNIIVATSGDTGSAVAAGFYDVDGIEVFVLYPKGKVSPLQEKQITTWGKNITAIEVNGTFDDCQALVKRTLNDRKVCEKFEISSANSINIARLIPQSFYYFSSFAPIQHHKKPIVYAVPSGNFGNLTAGLIAFKMGLPIQQFVAATNVNDVVPEFLKTGVYQPRPSIPTISNAMDVGAPSNFERMQQLFPNKEDVQKLIQGYTCTDLQTAQTLKLVYQQTGYVMDPHGSVAYNGLSQFLSENPNFLGVFLETAHPAKFKETVESILEKPIEIPRKLAVLVKQTTQNISIENDYERVISIITQKN